jgi:hypothetical protein
MVVRYMIIDDKNVKDQTINKSYQKVDVKSTESTDKKDVTENKKEAKKTV